MHPEQELILLEGSGSCGGTWGGERIYPGLKSNNLLDSYEYPGFPMAKAEETYGVKPGQHIPGAVLHRYLTDFAKAHGVYERVKFHHRVTEVSPAPDGGWTVTATVQGAASPLAFKTKKVIVATGLTSTPNLPTYKGADSFAGSIFHAKDFMKREDTLKSARNVTVVGGGKSAYDVAWAYVEQGNATVDLVIRPDGNGPVWISHPWVIGGAKRLEKLLHVRFLTWFSPCPWDNEDGYGWMKRWLHGTWLGRWVVDKFWATLAADVISLNGYNSHPEVKKLTPWASPFWIGSGLSIHNYDTNFFDLVKSGKIRVHIADVASVSAKAVHLSTGESLPADTIVCSTGWKKTPSISFSGFGIGLPQPKDEQTKLSDAADVELLQRFPRLAAQPTLRFKPARDPLRLYRFVVPPGYIQDRNIAFAGMVSSVSTSICADTQALWIAAFFDGKLDRLAATEDEVSKEVVLHTNWGKWRYPTGYGASLPDFVFDAVPYFDLLLNDLGLKALRKKGTYAELTEPYGPEDYEGLVEEWRAKKAKVA